MSFSNSAGAYSRIIDRSFVVTGAGLMVGGIVVTADRGPVTTNLVTSAREFINTYGTPSRDNPSLHSAIRFLNRAGALTVRRVINDAAVATGVIMDDTDISPVEAITVSSANPGTWGNNISITFSEIIGSTNSFLLTVLENGETVEQHEASRDTTAKNGYNQSLYIEDVINNGRSDYITVVDDITNASDVDLTQTVTLAGGTDDTATPDEAAIISAWDDFVSVDSVDAQLLINGGWASAPVQQKMTSVAQIRDDAVAILDVPEADSDDVTAMVAYYETLGSNTYYGGLYGGWLRVYDQYNDREVNVPPSGDVAATFVVTVANGERWDAPAGLINGIIPNALGVTKVFSEGERDVLYVNGINPVTSLGGASAVIWGQKTLIQPDSTALSRFNVINSLLWMQNRMKSALQPFVFQPNTSFTRDNINYLLSSFLDSIQSRGGLYGFNVDTSEEINTPQVIDSNQLMVEIHVQPTRAIEFIRMSLIVQRTGVQLG